ncbi:MAG TPA: hypothetical protein VF247_02080 [Candidatus Krumholzibacteria bacterium]
MSRKLWVIATVTLFSASAVLAGIGLSRGNAMACDESNKTASATTETHSCCAKDGAKTASTDAKKVHNAMIKSAVVAPGAAPILNAAAFGGMLAGGKDCPPCDWCPEMTTASVNAAHAGYANMSAAECASKMSSAECAAMKASAAGCTGMKTTTASLNSYEGQALPAGHPAIDGHSSCSSAAKTASSEGCTAHMAKVASSEGCTAHMSTVAASSEGAGHSATMMAGGDGCAKGSAAAAGNKEAACCDSKTASAAGSGEKCSSAKTASLKGKVDELSYREGKRIVLAGSYACGHCTLQKTEDCSPMFKTADGKVYPLLQNNHAKEMRGDEGKNLEVSGTVKKVDGVKVIEVKSYKVL